MSRGNRPFSAPSWGRGGGTRPGGAETSLMMQHSATEAAQVAVLSMLHVFHTLSPVLPIHPLSFKAKCRRPRPPFAIGNPAGSSLWPFGASSERATLLGSPPPDGFCAAPLMWDPGAVAPRELRRALRLDAAQLQGGVGGLEQERAGGGGRWAHDCG